MGLQKARSVDLGRQSEDTSFEREFEARSVDDRLRLDPGNQLLPRMEWQHLTVDMEGNLGPANGEHIDGAF
ncbi:MAG: hypothetical protein R2710_04270 [Acidimicrobiales bacterium]